MLLSNPPKSAQKKNEVDLDENLSHLKPSATSLLKSLRYPVILGKDWNELPHSIQQRFVKPQSPRKVVIYRGRIYKTRVSFLGLVLAKLSKLIGAPLPLNNKIRGPATVEVREARDFSGQYWTRIYPSNSHFPQTIKSIKRFAGPTGLEELLSKRVGIALNVKVAQNKLFFHSDHYFFLLRNKRISLPGFLSPGALTIEHKETGPHKFRYTFSLRHGVFGELIYQTAIFEEIKS